MYKLKTKSANKYILVNKHPHTKEEREREKKKKKRERERERNISCGPIAPLPLWTKPNIGITSKIFGCLKLKLHSFLPLSLSIMDSQCMPSSPSLHPKIHRNAKLNPSWEASHLRKTTICFKSRMYDTCKTPSFYLHWFHHLQFHCYIRTNDFYFFLAAVTTLASASISKSKIHSLLGNLMLERQRNISHNWEKNLAR